MLTRTCTLLLFFSVFISCQKDANLDFGDGDLSAALAEASEYAGKTHFILPNSDDYRRIPQDVQNLISKEKVQLGQLLFHETAFALNSNFDNSMQSFSCSSCHNAMSGFHSGRMQGIADGGMGFGHAGEGRIKNPDCEETLIDVQQIRVPSNLNAAYQTNLLWNGAFGATNINAGTESLWTPDNDTDKNFLGYEGLETQAIVGLEFHRMKYNRELVTEFGYKELFDAAFPNIPEDDRYNFERAGQAIAAFERTMMSNQAPFQKWLRGDESAMTQAQKEGAILFFGKAGCANCHNGPSLANMEFHAIGFNNFDDKVFNHNPNDGSSKGRASFTNDEQDLFKFKVPQLYNLKNVEFLGHGSSFKTLREVIEYKNEAVPQNGNVSDSHLSEFFVPLLLDDLEIDLLVDFVENGLYDPALERYVPKELPSGLCFPNNDEVSRIDLGCN